MSKKLLLCFALLIGLVSFAIAQRTVTGTVTDELTKEPLIQATVVIKGTTQGTVTDENGKFKLDNVANGAVLTVSYAGYINQDINSGVLSDVVVILKPDAVETVVVQGGYVVEEKRSSVGAIAGVKGAVIEGMPAQTFDRAMQGRIAGVQVAATSGQPGGALSIRIRGVGSINASNEPLYIVDGVQLRSGSITGQGSSNALGSINPNDIESIEVLKDAAASAIYGAQAANGVVLITTKRGSNKGGSTVTFSAQEGTVQPLKLYEMMNSRQLAQIKQAAFINSGSSVASAIAAYGDPNDPNLNNYDWVNAVFRTGKQSTYDVNISGGDKNTTYYTALGYTRQEGQILQNYWQRLSFKTSLTHRANDKFSMGATINGSWQNSYGAIENGNFVNGPFSSTFTMQPAISAIRSDGGYAIYPNTHNFGYNIVQGLNEEVRTAKMFQFIASANFAYKITKDLTLNGLAGVDFQDGRDDNKRPSSIPAFAGTRGSILVAYRRLVNANASMFFQYAKTFNQVHKISAILGYEHKFQQIETASISTRGFSSTRLMQLAFATGINSTGGNPVYPTLGGSTSEFKREGFFGQVKYEYDDRYFAEFTLRRDGSSRFGTSMQYGNFYAAALAWRISSESFMANTKNIISDMKLRVSYGVLGNSEIGDFASRYLYGNGGAVNSTYNGTNVYRLSNIANPDLGWERQSQFNVGADIELWKGKVTLTLDYWNKINDDLLMVVNAPADAGIGGYNGNAAKVLNRGFDIDLSTKNVDYKGFKWVTSFNISFLKNEVLALPFGQGRLGSSYFVGQPISTIWGDVYAGVNPANGRVVVLDTLGNPTYALGSGATQQVIGKGTPDYYGGINNTFSYKGVTLDIFFQYQGGNSAFIGDLYNIANAGSSQDNQLVSQLAYWQKPGDVTNVPKPVEGGVIEGFNQSGNASTRFVSDASYLRLKQIRLAYEVPSDKLSKFFIKRVNIYAQAINLWTYTKFAGIDPEVVGQTSTNGSSTYGTYPQGRQFNIGCVMSF